MHTKCSESLRADLAFLTASDVAELLAVSTRTVWRLESAGRIPKAHRLGRIPRWNQADLLRWRDNGFQESK